MRLLDRLLESTWQFLCSFLAVMSDEIALQGAIESRAVVVKQVALPEFELDFGTRLKLL